MAVASCTLIHVGFVATGFEYVLHDLGDGLREMADFEPAHGHELHNH